MKKNTLKILASLFLISGLISCKKQEIQPELIPEALEIRYQDVSDAIVGNPVDVWLTNTTEYCVEFDLVNRLHIFVEQNEKWVQVPNLVEYLGSTVLTLKPKDDFYSSGLIHIQPDTTHLVIDSLTKAYALLTGHLCEDANVEIQKEIPFSVNP